MEIGTSLTPLNRVCFVVLLLLVFRLGFGHSIEKIQQFEVPADFRISQHRYGGISGLSFQGDHLWAVSDDRGQYGPPRVYKQKLFRNSRQQLEVRPESELVLGQVKGFAVLDLESIFALKDGRFILSSEGDFNKKPRVFPFVKTWSKVAGWGESLDLAEDFFPETTGLQTKGLYNNSGFEGMTVSTDEHNLYLMSELPLFQSKKPDIEFLHYKKSTKSEKSSNEPVSWVLFERKKFQRNSGSTEAGEIMRGVTEILFWKSDFILVLERWVRLGSLKPLNTGAELFSVRLSNFEKKKLFTLDGELAGNWEGMTFAPDLSDGRKLLVLVTDNNFEKGEPTKYLFLALKE